MHLELTLGFKKKFFNNTPMSITTSKTSWVIIQTKIDPTTLYRTIDCQAIYIRFYTSLKSLQELTFNNNFWSVVFELFLLNRWCKLIIIWIQRFTERFKCFHTVVIWLHVKI